MERLLQQTEEINAFAELIDPGLNYGSCVFVQGPALKQVFLQTPEGKFVLDAKVFYEDVYSGTDYQHHNNQVLSGVTINVILTDEEGEKIHTATAFLLPHG